MFEEEEVDERIWEDAWSHSARHGDANWSELPEMQGETESESESEEDEIVDTSLTVRSLDSYDPPYPDRNHPDIQSLLMCHKEFRRLKSGPNPLEDERVSDVFFNSQLCAAQLLYIYGSLAIFWGMGAGKTAIVEAYRRLMEDRNPGVLTGIYWVAAKPQLKEFMHEMTVNFAEGAMKDKYDAAGENVGGMLNYKQVIKAQFKVAKDYMAQKRYSMHTYSAMSKLIDSMTNEQLTETFSRAAVGVDEIQFLKLTESRDTNVTPRPRGMERVKTKKGFAPDIAAEPKQHFERERMTEYKSFWRLTHVVPSCTFFILTGTPITHDLNELIYALNLLPNTPQIRTRLSWAIAQSMAALEEDYRVPMPSEWVDVDLRAEDVTRQLEAAARGRISRVRTPYTGAYQIYPSSYPPQRVIRASESLRRTVTLLLMSRFQAEAYLNAYWTMTRARGTRGGSIHERDSLYHKCVQTCVIAFPSTDYMHMRLQGMTYEEIFAVRPAACKALLGKEGLESVSYIETEEREWVYATGRHEQKVRAEGKVTVVSKQVLHPTKLFSDFLARDDCLSEISCKIFDMVKGLEENEGSERRGLLYSASGYNAITCQVIGWTLEARRWERFRPFAGKWIDPATKQLVLPANRRRFALMTSDNDTDIPSILRLGYHPDNWQGDYLRSVITSPIATVGLNIGNAWGMTMIDPPFTDESAAQTEARVYRPRSHRYIMAHTGQSTFGVMTNFYVAELPDIEGVPVDEEGELDTSTIDWKLYESICENGIEAGPVLRAVDEVAIDAPINRGRNMRPDDRPFSPEVHYMATTKFKPYNYHHLPTRTDTYDAYFLSQTLEETVAAICALIKRLEISTIDISDVLRLLRGGKAQIIAAIRYVVENRVSVGRNRLGFPIYLEEEAGVLYCTNRAVSQGLSTDRLLAEYYSLQTFSQTQTIESRATDWVGEGDELEQHISFLSSPSAYAEEYLTLIPTTPKAALFELACLRDDESWAEKVILALSPFYIISDVRDSSELNIEKVIVHQLLNLFYRGQNFDAVGSLLFRRSGEGFGQTRASTNLRIYRGGLWRHCTADESSFFSPKLTEQIEKEVQPMYDAFSSIGFIGLIIRPDAVHVRDIFWDVSGKGKWSGEEGKRITEFKLHELVTMLYRMCSNVQEWELAEDERAFAMKIIRGTRGLGKMKEETLQLASNAEIAFIYNLTIEYGSKLSASLLVDRLTKCMADKGAIKPLVGSLRLTLSTLGLD